MDVKADWYDAVAQRTSRRRFDGRAVPDDLREQLEVFCDGASAPAGGPTSRAVEPGLVTAPARVCIVDDARQELFTGLVGGYGKVSGTPVAAAFVGRVPAGDDAPDEVKAAVGYLGEALILEATRLGLGTCWIAGTFDKAAAGRLAHLEAGERVLAVTPLGYAVELHAGSERVMRSLVKASARLSVERLAPGILDGGWPAWAVSAVQTARLAPSGANRQPWRFRLEGGALVLTRAEKLYWTAPIDFGIARLHVELGALHAGVTGVWTPLGAPDVASFTPAG